ncbi:sodium:solute symporter family protein [Saxibacter everestensis]|uniref:Sodium:solute symporter family protein n=1 Tax=Saxibacter everestensis TaxID=2909229 RepID=A0ABY8QTG6_9MICO|nr:sodium:solute symporter family protein [Brevibacteriaceae bacterium ZFBP1038]
MSLTFWVAIIGMVGIAVVAIRGRSKPHTDLAEWTVGKRNYGTLTMWFLQAGEAFTTFTFLGVAGIAFSAGAASSYAIPYIPLGYIGLFFIGPIVWRYAKDRSYITQADFFADRYQSPWLGKIVAICGVVFLLPYLQLQITGLGLIVKLVTGNATSGVISMVVATVLTVVFVLWAGIHGLARTAYIKDALMIGAMALLIIVIPLHYAGGISHVFESVAAMDEKLLTIQAGEYSQMWWLSSMLISAIGSAFLTLPHLWPPMLAAKSARVIRSNNVYLSLYQVVIIFPLFIGFTALLVLPRDAASNSVLLTLAREALPDWVTGLVAVAAASAAMIPAAALCIGISTLVSHNLVRTKSMRTKLRINHFVVVIAASLALVLGILRPDLLANLLLLTFAGLSQLAPGITAALPKQPIAQKASVLAGIVAGVAVVMLFTFTGLPHAEIDPGILGLAANVVVLMLTEAGLRATGRRPVAISTQPLRSIPEATEHPQEESV